VIIACGVFERMLVCSFQSGDGVFERSTSIAVPCDWTLVEDNGIVENVDVIELGGGDACIGDTCIGDICIGDGIEADSVSVVLFRDDEGDSELPKLRLVIFIK